MAEQGIGQGIEATVAGEARRLPRYDMAMARRLAAVDDADGREATWRAEWELLQAAIGRDATRSAVGGDRLESCDLLALDSACAEVRAAYEAPQEEVARRRIEDALSVVSGADLDRLVAAADAMERLASRQASRQGFSRVR